MELLKKYKEAEQALHDYFGYVEDWVVIPIEDNTEYYWKLDQEIPGDDRSSGEVSYAANPGDIGNWDEDADWYSAVIYTQRFLPKFVYRGADYTMVSADTQCDGNKFLMIFDNKKEIENA